MTRKIRIAIIDDSLLFRTFLQQTFMANPDLEVVGVYADPVEALERIPQARPDVLTVDMEMPKMRGNEFMRKFLPKNPGVKAIVISALSGNVFDALQAGAVDFVGKPNSQPGYTNAAFREDIIEKIMAAAAAKNQIAPAARPAVRASALPRPSLTRVTDKSILAIGASTGGTEAILEVIREFPADMPGVVIVQHMPPGFTKQYADRADRVCKMAVREAQNHDRVERGLILIAPGGSQQMRVVASGMGYMVELREEAKVSGHCPSVDVLFDSVAGAAGRTAVGVILTGMGADGAQGLKKMRQAGAHTIGQDENTCVVYGMPKVAYDIGGVAEQLPLGSIAQGVMRHLSR